MSTEPTTPEFVGYLTKPFKLADVVIMICWRRNEGAVMSQSDWVVDHLRRYQETNGKDGHLWGGPDGTQSLPCLLLTTTGSKSGEARLTPLIYGEDDGRYVIIASRGGAPEHPSWYTNLAATPAVNLQIGAEKFAAAARIASGDERTRLWQLMAKIYPPYDDYQEKAKNSREIPLVVLERS